MKKYILTSLLLLTVISSVIADELSFVASAPKSVVVNQQFRLSYKVNRINVNEPTIPEIKGFMVLSGPGRSTMQSYSSDINGKTTAENSGIILSDIAFGCSFGEREAVK